MNEMLLLRLFVEVNTEESALESSKRIMAIIKSFAEVENHYVQKYWKISEYYEIFFQLNLFNNLSKDYQCILEKLGCGWEVINEFDCVWNPDDKKIFVLKEVKWAHLEGRIE